MTRPAGLLFSRDESPPPLILVLTTLQHVAVIAISLIIPLILAREAGLLGAQLLNYVSLSMIGVGVGTLLLCWRSRYVGTGYLCPAGFTPIYLGPSISALPHGGMAGVFSMTLIAGMAQLGIAPVLKRLRSLLPPEIAGLVIAIIGLSIAILGVRYSLGVTPTRGVQPAYLFIALASLVTMVVLNVWTKGFLRMFCVLIGMGVGTLLSLVLDDPSLTTAVFSAQIPLLALPRPSLLEWQFDIASLAPFLVASLAATVKIMGDTSNAQRVDDAGWVRPDFRSLSGGVAASGLASIFCGSIGACALNSQSSNIGLSEATGITSRRVGYAIGLSFILLGFVPAAAVVFATIPEPVMGATQFFLAAFIFTSGLQMITSRMLDARKILVIGFSFAMAVMSDVYRDVFLAMPPVLQPIFGNSLVLGTACAVLLNLVMRLGVRQKVTLKLAPDKLDRDQVEQFLAAQGAVWAARREIVSRATFGVVQLLEVVGSPSSEVEIEASFDEFNLDIHVRFAGEPFVIPDKRPSPRDIVMHPQGEKLLAGYLLRRSADRVSSRVAGGRVDIHLHFDH